MEVLDYHKLKIFKVVADVKSFSKASELLFLTQPTITQQIKKIENYLGITLFKRDKSGVYLTKEGERFYKYVEKILEDYQILEKEIISLKQKKNQTLFIGASSTIGEYLLPPILAKFLKGKDYIKTNLFIGNSKEVEEGVLSKTFYIGLIEDDINSSKFDRYKFFEDEIVLIASSKNPIPEEIEIKELEKHKIIFREKGSGTRNIVQKFLKIKNININPVMEIGSSKAIAKIVENTDLLGFVSKLIVEGQLKNGQIKPVRIKNLIIKRNFYYITQKNINLPQIDREFLLYLEKNTP
ncbi:MAG: LysR family transcriptional regulator [Persephonella sp.]|nr:MAG: LysR family transcriptional regulator [Persephonella sp.]RUM60694.1 MAG: LysR family transcriptional regulator [Persephonella sp.]